LSAFSTVVLNFEAGFSFVDIEKTAAADGTHAATRRKP